MEINNKAMQNRERLDNAVFCRNNAKKTRRPVFHNQKSGNDGGVNGTSLLNKLLNLANDKFVTKSAGNTPCGSPIQPYAMSPDNLSPRPLAKSDICLPQREIIPLRDMTKSYDVVSIRAIRRISSPTHEKRLNVALQQQQVPQAQRILIPKCSRKVLRPTSSRYLLARIDCNRHENDIDSDSTTMTATSGETDESLSEDGCMTFCMDETQLQFLKEKLQAYEDDYRTTMSDDEEKEEVGCEFKNATPSNRNKKRSEIVLSPSARILQAGFATYKRYPNGIVNFVRTDIHVANWRFCYVCALDSPNTRYIRQLTLTDVIHNYAGFDECQIFRIVKFCAACFQRYNENAAKQPDHPLRVRMTTYATNLFCTL